MNKSDSSRSKPSRASPLPSNGMRSKPLDAASITRGWAARKRATTKYTCGCATCQRRERHDKPPEYDLSLQGGGSVGIRSGHTHSRQKKPKHRGEGLRRGYNPEGIEYLVCITSKQLLRHVKKQGCRSEDLRGHLLLTGGYVGIYAIVPIPTLVPRRAGEALRIHTIATSN